MHVRMKVSVCACEKNEGMDHPNGHLHMHMCTSLLLLLSIGGVGRSATENIVSHMSGVPEKLYLISYYIRQHCAKCFAPQRL